jgi:hypothetical protein
VIPELPDKRPYDYYNIDERIYVVFLRTDNPTIEEGKWYSGLVRHGYRHHDGCVSYKLDEVGPQDDNSFWGCGMAVPTILKEEEYIYFQNNPEQYYSWCQVSYKKSYNGEKFDPPIIPGTEYVFARMELIKE